jgi:AcrR family transcriptional regulator
LDVAREMFVRHGYEATTMRAIAAKIEYTPTAIYHHFRSKEALLTELCNTDFRGLATAFRRIGQVEDPIERLRRAGHAYVTFALDHPMQYQLMFMTRRPYIEDRATAGDDPEKEAYAFLRAACGEALAGGRFGAEFRDVEEIAQILWSGLHGLLALHIVRHDSHLAKPDAQRINWRDPGRTAGHLIDVLFTGLLAQPTP